MKASDLRIGNFVWYNGMYLTVSEIYTPKPRKPKQFDGVECVELLCDGFITATMDEIKPIPITEEILLKCGFAISKSNDCFDRTVYEIQISNSTSLYFDRHKDWMRNDLNLEWYLSHEWNNNSFKNEFGWNNPKHLHQLQNLIYALTGEELNVQL